MNNTKPSIIFSYYRVSSEEQYREGFSVAAQRKLIRTYAEENDLPITEEFQDVESAKHAGRKEFTRMLSEFQKYRDLGDEKCPNLILLVEKTDRAMRNIKDWVILDDLQLDGIHFVKENFVLDIHTKSTERFIHGIKVLMARQYVENLSEETRKGLLEKAEQGWVPMRGPIGYATVRRDGRSVLEPDSKAPHIADLFKKYASGMHSLDTLYRHAAKEGVLITKSGNPIARSTISVVLRNPTYCGRFKFRGQIYPGKHQPIVTRELFDIVQRMLTENCNLQITKPKYNWMFQGLIRCKLCGCTMTVEKKKEKYVYYHCTDYKKGCSRKCVREEVLIELFRKKIQELQFSESLDKKVMDSLKQSHLELQRHKENLRAVLEDGFKHVGGKLKTLYDDRLEHRIDVDFYEKQKIALRLEQDEIAQRMLTLEDQNRNYLDLGVKIIEIAENAVIAYDRATPTKRRELLNFLLSNCEYGAGELTVKWRQPFDLLPLIASEDQKKRAVSDEENSPCPEKLPRLDSNQ